MESVDPTAEAEELAAFLENNAASYDLDDPDRLPSRIRLAADRLTDLLLENGTDLYDELFRKGYASTMARLGRDGWDCCGMGNARAPASQHPHRDPGED